jgi:predicted SnoaL-like aldol condensation-catalyzing enzyme
MSRPTCACGVHLQANKQLAVRWLDLVSEADVEEMVRTCTSTWQMHGGPPGLPTGPDGVRALFAHLGRVRQRWTIDDVVAEGDRVVVRGTNHGEQDEFLGIPARGVEQVFTATFVFRIERGRVAEVWRNADDLGRVVQLGARIVAPETI